VVPGKEEYKIHLINEPLGSSPKGSAVFLVETGESRTPSETQEILEWVSREMTEKLMKTIGC
jgi:site-specific DNA recombinase